MNIKTIEQQIRAEYIKALMALSLYWCLSKMVKTHAAKNRKHQYANEILDESQTLANLLFFHKMV